MSYIPKIVFLCVVVLVGSPRQSAVVCNRESARPSIPLTGASSSMKDSQALDSEVFTSVAFVDYTLHRTQEKFLFTDFLLSKKALPKPRHTLFSKLRTCFYTMLVYSFVSCGIIWRSGDYKRKSPVWLFLFWFWQQFLRIKTFICTGYTYTHLKCQFTVHCVSLCLNIRLIPQIYIFLLPLLTVYFIGKLYMM